MLVQRGMAQALRNRHRRGGAVQRVKNLLVVMPGFAADCVETLEEVAIGLRGIFLKNGGKNFATVPCLNDRPDSIGMLASIVRNELQGWI